MKAIAFFIAVLFTVAAHSQNSINNYKYVIVPERFEIFKSDNQYGINTLTKMLLDDVGFTAVMGNQLPAEVTANKCGALRAELTEKKGFFVTTVTLLLKDCQNNVVFKSKDGKSREKEWQAAYDEALRDAFTSLKSAQYKYDATAAAAVQTQAATVTPAAPAQTQAPITTTPAAPAPAPSATADITGILYAQATANGYQLIDTAPKKVLTLLKTSLPDQYIAEGGPANGVVFKKNEEWVFEYYKDNKLVSQKLNIKF